MTALLRRLAALEARQAKEDASRPRPPSKALLLFRAILDAIDANPPPDGYMHDTPEPEGIYRRHQAGASTEWDRAILASLPDFGIDPLELLSVLMGRNVIGYRQP